MDKNNKDIITIILMFTFFILIMIYSIDNPKTLKRIGDYYIGNQNYETAEKYYKRASNKGDLEASFNYSCLIADKNPEEAMKFAIIAADGGLAKAMYNAGTFFLKKNPPDLENAEKYLKLALKNDVKKAYTNLGICYQFRKEKEKDKKKKAEYENKSYEYFKKGAENNDDLSMLYLSYYYSDKNNFKESYNLIDKSAEKGNIIALKLKGLYLIEGKGVEKNSEEGYKYLEKSAEKGDKSAMLLAGLYKAKNKKTDEDIKIAKKWLEKAKKIKIETKEKEENQKLIKELEELVKKHEK